MSSDKNDEILHQALNDLDRLPRFAGSKPLQMFMRYAEEGGLKAVNALNDRLHEGALTVEDIANIHNLYFPGRTAMTRREACAWLVTAGVLSAAVPTFLKGSYHMVMAHVAGGGAANRQRHWQKTKAYMPPGLLLTYGAKKSYEITEKQHAHSYARLEKSEDFKQALARLIDERGPLLDAVAERLATPPGQQRGRE